jgi:hypothetical protein
MRPSTTVLGAAAGLVLALGWAGTAGAATTAIAPTPTAGTTSPAAVFVSSPTAAPGQTVHVDGTCALPSSGPMPTVVSVTSPAFTGPEVFSKTDPDAFDGTATIRSNAAAGSYTVTLTCSNGTATTDFRVVAASGGNSGAVTPNPVAPSVAPPAAPSAPATQPAAAPANHSSGDSVALGVTGIAIVAAGAAGYVAVTRRRSSGKHRDHAGV